MRAPKNPELNTVYDGVIPEGKEGWEAVVYSHLYIDGKAPVKWESKHKHWKGANFCVWPKPKVGRADRMMRHMCRGYAFTKFGNERSTQTETSGNGQAQ